MDDLTSQTFDFPSAKLVPDIWGEGAISAFSGMVSPTRTTSQFVYSSVLLIHLPVCYWCELRLTDHAQINTATNDTRVVDSPDVLEAV